MENWPTNKEWREFAAKIADAVTRSINLGGNVRCSPMDLFCSLPYPDPSINALPGSFAMRRAFMDGYDNGIYDSGEYLSENEIAAYQLGRAYRKKYPYLFRPA